MPGPVPNRSEDLSRDRSRRGAAAGPAVTNGTMRPVVIPEGDPDWHPIATMLWDSLAVSGQSDFYQQSDWAMAYSLCEDLSRYKQPWKTVRNEETGELEEWHKRSGQMLQTIYSAMSNLLVTEGDRRRVRIELQAPEPEQDDAAVLAIADYRAELEADTDE